MSLYIFPVHHFNPASVKADPVQTVISGGVALNGEEDVIATDGGGRWRITYSGIVLRSPFLLRLWDAWTGHLAGGAQQVLCPLLSLATAPRPFAGSGTARPSALHTDDPMFPTVAAYASPHILAETVGTMPNPSTVTIEVTQGARIEGGEKFSVPGMRGHKIDRVISRSGQQATVRITPPALTLIPDATSVVFDWPLVKCRALPGQDLSPDVAYGRRAEMSITFMEDGTDAD